MRLYISVLTVLVGFLVTCSLGEAKPGKGRGGGRGRANVSAALGSPLIDARGSSRFSSSFPRGNAWGLRRNLGLDNPGSRRDRRFREDGDRIFRGGQQWEWDADAASWFLLR